MLSNRLVASTVGAALLLQEAAFELSSKSGCCEAATAESYPKGLVVAFAFATAKVAMLQLQLLLLLLLPKYKTGKRKLSRKFLLFFKKT